MLLFPLGVKVMRQPVDRRGLDPLADAALFFSYRALMRREKPDAVFTYTIKPNIYGGIACRILEGNGYETFNFSGGFRFYDAVVNDRALIEKSFPCGMDK